ncbi:MAG: hypothetical protein ThorAB25_03130 [Candidatus Thorarchaeota archaeon AB_25]|nr:MAG: hypothetical protein ThorAB25_03130 [Candidatus Thorarchaeota archaeon AB_25]
MDSLDSENNEYDWSEIKPPVADSFQFKVFLAHVVLGVIISVLCLSGGWFSWGIGIGVVTPIMLAVAGSFYYMTTGINWYRDEFIPYLTRIQMIPEFETDRFLKYQRLHQITKLISGYLAVVVTQFTWTQIVNFVLIFSGDLLDLLELLGMILVGMFFLQLLVMFLFYGAFVYILQSMFSDVSYLIKIEEKMTKYFNDKKKKEKEMENEVEESGIDTGS